MDSIVNPSFEGGWTRRTHTGEEFGEIFVPKGWVAYWRTGPAPHDPSNPNGYGRPEMHVINKEAPFLDPPRIRSGERSLKFFTFYRIHDAGVYQVVEGITPGQRVVATGWAHAWSSGKDDPKKSDGWHVGAGAVCLDEYTQGLDDGDRNVTFRVGIDPTGATDPWGESVVWGPGRHIYNAYAQIPELEVTAQAEAVTVFVRSSVLWPFKHCDAYVDDMSLEVVGEEPAEPPVIIEPKPEPVTYAYPIVAKGSKLHPHAVGEAGTYDLLTYLAEHDTPLPFLKVVACKPADLPAIRNLKALSPLAEIIARVILGDDGFNPQGWGPTLKAETYMAQIVKWAKAYPEAKYWSLWNEQDPADHVPMARFAIECMAIAEREGFKLVLMDYSSGVPENADWQAIWDQTDFFQRAKAGGHILGLHAYCRTANAAQTAAHLQRPRWLYETLLIQNDCVVPFVFTEYSIDEMAAGIGIGDWSVIDLMAEYQRADALLAEMWYCLGASLYTFGQLADYNHNTLWRNVAEVIVAARDRQNALPPAAEPEPEPPVGYNRVVIMADPTYMTAAQIAAAYKRGQDELRTVSPSWQDAVPPAAERPEEWLTNTVDAGPMPAGERTRYATWVSDRDPGTVLVFDPLPDPKPIGGEGLAIVDVRAQMATNPDSPWYPWKRRTFGEITHVFVHHSAGAASNDVATVKAIAAYHTSPTGKNRPGICYTYVIGSEGTVWQVSDIENVVFSQGSLDYPGDENRWGVGVCLLGSFIAGREPSAEQLRSLRALIGMLAEKVGRTLQVWGHKDVASTRCPGDSWPFAESWGRGAKPRTATLIGFNDQGGETGTGCKWLMTEGKGGLIVQPAFIGGTPIAFDGAAAAAAGIRVIINLRYSWSTDCGGAGTLPARTSPEWQQFIDAAVASILTSKGVWGWTISNEANNPREFPKGANLTASDVVAAYNAIRSRVPTGTRMSPGALDPFNAQAGDPRVWLATIYGGISGAEFVDAHGYVRGPDPALVGSTAKFQDAPLQWQYLNYPGCVTAPLEVLPAGYRALPVYVSEFNHLWKTIEGDWGWTNDARAAEIVRRAHIAAGVLGFAGVALYRWAGDEWTIEKNGSVLEAVREQLS